VVEVVDPTTKRQLGPGEHGEPVVTYFDESYPLLRFATGDITYYSDEPCPCGRTSRRLAGWLGRIGEAIKVKERFMHPREIEGVIADIPQVSNFQVVVSQEEHKDVLTLNAEVSSREVDGSKLVELLRERIRAVSTLDVDNVNLVPRGTIRDGKKKVIDERVWD